MLASCLSRVATVAALVGGMAHLSAQQAWHHQPATRWRTTLRATAW